MSSFLLYHVTNNFPTKDKGQRRKDVSWLTDATKVSQTGSAIESEENILKIKYCNVGRSNNANEKVHSFAYLDSMMTSGDIQNHVAIPRRIIINLEQR